MVQVTPERERDEFGEAKSRNTFDEDGFARARWTYDENGFMKARVNALDAARSRLVNATHAENATIIAGFNPSSVEREIDGVSGAPYDSIKL